MSAIAIAIAIAIVSVSVCVSVTKARVAFLHSPRYRALLNPHSFLTCTSGSRCLPAFLVGLDEPMMVVNANEAVQRGAVQQRVFARRRATVAFRMGRFDQRPWQVPRQA